MSKNRIILVCVLAVICAVGCKSKFETLLSSNDVELKYNEAFNLFNTKKYKKAASLFESLSMLTSGMPQDDTVRYYWALSNYKYKDYVTAEANFGSFVEIYPRSPFTPEARFLRMDCMYRNTYRYELDQNPTNLAIMEIQQYMLDYPESERLYVCHQMLDDLTNRLEKKAYENARLYYKMEDYIAAKTSFRNVLKDNPDNRYRENIQYYIAKSCYKYAYLSVPAKQKERYMEFQDEYFNFVGEHPKSEFRKELDQLYARSQSAISASDKVLDRKTLRKQKREDRKIEKTLNKEK